MEHQDPSDLSNIWQGLDGKKGSIISRCEQYAMWTVPSVCPMENEDGDAQSKGNVAVGARLVNHLANRIVDTMFPSDRPFFAIALSPEAKKQMAKEYTEDEEADLAQDIRKATSEAENLAMRELNLTAYRPIAVQAVQHQIITGNAVIHRSDDGTRVVYGIKDFCVQRDVKGAMLRCILKDSKTFGSLPDSIQDKLHETRPELKDDDEVTLYTLYWLRYGKWHRLQAVDDIDLPETRTSYKEVDLPVLALTWNLSRGESYGRGLVEDHAVQFHNIDVSTLALIDLIGIAADIKFLVDPSSQLDIDEWNSTARGGYVTGRKDDVTVPDYPKRLEIQVIRESVNEWSRELAQAFLLNSAGIRDAERVTAEEIRFYARELEGAFGGLYSRLALGWQQKEAEYLISSVDFSVSTENGVKTFDVVVTTGLESLSREGQLDNLRLAIGDLQMLDAVPEDVRNVLNKRKFAEFIFTNRGVNLAEFVHTEQELQAMQQQAMQQEQQMMAAQGQQDVAVEAGKAAAKGGQ
tara:strand:+ start:13691 stop:15253 length:1563 start_codon:yes stop_codon:yes gene_type:complete